LALPKASVTSLWHDLFSLQAGSGHHHSQSSKKIIGLRRCGISSRPIDVAERGFCSPVNSRRDSGSSVAIVLFLQKLCNSETAGQLPRQLRGRQGFASEVARICIRSRAVDRTLGDSL
jgi:hypothetical protein